MIYGLALDELAAADRLAGDWSGRSTSRYGQLTLALIGNAAAWQATSAPTPDYL